MPRRGGKWVCLIIAIGRRIGSPRIGTKTSASSQPAPLLRRNFNAENDLVAARIYATSLGLYELRLNGQRVGDAVLTPGWTSYDHRLQYQTYDVTGLMREGDNVLGAILGDGWYRGYMGFTGDRNLYGDRLALLLQLHLTYADGRVEIIGSDEQWRATRGPIQMSDIYMGETYDARQEKPGWDETGYDDSDWHGVRRLDHPKEIVVAQVGPFIRRQERLRPVRILHSPKGETILDFGQNMVGWVQMRVRGPAGHHYHPAPRRGVGPAGQSLHRKLAPGRPNNALHFERCGRDR